MNSFNMSFWIVPDNWSLENPLSLATNSYINSNIPAVELKEYLMSIPNFFRYEPNYMVETIDGKIYNHVPTNYKVWHMGRLDIKIIKYTKLNLKILIF